MELWGSSPAKQPQPTAATDHPQHHTMTTVADSITQLAQQILLKMCPYKGAIMVYSYISELVLGRHSLRFARLAPFTHQRMWWNR
ncbi:MAG: hypothetical protein DCF32_07610 [Leptolyngbya sp.]|nr:MAG: hypothetical protein DCF32_07610 [Leptolyngbya sp.]